MYAENYGAVHQLSADGRNIEMTFTDSEIGASNRELLFQLNLYCNRSVTKFFDCSKSFLLPDGSVFTLDESLNS